MKKLSCLLALLCCMMMSLSVAYASPLTGDTSNMAPVDRHGGHRCGASGGAGHHGKKEETVIKT